jgi:hypothetical protein
VENVRVKAVVAALLLAGGAGCQTTGNPSLTSTVTSMKRAVGLAPEPVSEVLSFWQRRLAMLSDPTHDGMMVHGLVGQVFMISPTSHHARAEGSLTVAVYDATRRPPGQKEHDAEIFVFRNEQLDKLRTKDERFGECYAIFLPWRPDWADVTDLRILTRYDAEGQTPLHSREVTMQLEAGKPGVVWEGQTTRQVGNMVPNGPPPSGVSVGDLRGVPDPRAAIAAVESGKAQQPPELPKPVPIRSSNVPVTDRAAGPDAPQLLPVSTAPTPPEPQQSSRVELPPDGRPVMTVVDKAQVANVAPNSVNATYSTPGAYAGPRPDAAPLPPPALGPAPPGGMLQPIIIHRNAN